MSKLSRVLTAVLVAVMVAYAGMVAYVEESKPVLPPNRFGDATVHDIFCPESLGLVGRVDAVARVLIGDWLGDSIYHYTLYDAAVLECYSGDLPERIVVRLEGSSQNPITGSPLYTYGNELLLLLSETGAADMGHNSVYASSQLGFTAFYIGYDDGGTAYAVPCKLNRLHHGEDIKNRADAVGDEVLSGLIENDPEVWSDRSVETAFLLDDLVARINEILTANSTEPPEVSLSVDGEVIALEPYSYEWATLHSPNEVLEGEQPLLLSDEEWEALPYVKGEPSEVEVLCRVEPNSVSIHGWHESYRNEDDPRLSNYNDWEYIDESENGAFAIKSDSGYVYSVYVSWNSDPESDAPQFKGYARYAFRVGRTKKIAADKATLASFDKYPAAQLSNLLRDTPRADILERFGEPDVVYDDDNVWMTDGGRYVRMSYHGDEVVVRSAKSSLGLPIPPPLLLTVDGESYPLRRGTTSWMYTVEGERASGSSTLYPAAEGWDRSGDTIHTTASEAVITLDLPERIAERFTVEIDGAEIAADSTGEAFSLYRGAFTYRLTVHFEEYADGDDQSLSGGTVHYVFRVDADY